MITHSQIMRNSVHRISDLASAKFGIKTNASPELVRCDFESVFYRIFFTGSLKVPGKIINQ